MTPLTVLNLRATVITQWLGALGFHTVSGIPISWDTSRGLPIAIAHASRDEVLDAANRTIPTAESLEWELGGQRLPWQAPITNRSPSRGRRTRSAAIPTTVF